MEVNSYNMRTVLMYYYRFKRQFISCSEVNTDCGEAADVLVATKKHMIEIEIKTSKSDLINGEAKKEKHKKLNEKRVVNKYFICVPTELIEDAKLWIATINPKYGLIEFITQNSKRDFVRYEDLIHIVFNAEVLQPTFSEHLKDKMFKRLSSALTSEYMGKTK